MATVMIFRDGGAGRAGQAELTQQPWRHCTQASCGWQFSLPIIIAQKKVMLYCPER